MIMILLLKVESTINQVGQNCKMAMFLNNMKMIPWFIFCLLWEYLPYVIFCVCGVHGTWDDCNRSRLKGSHYWVSCVHSLIDQLSDQVTNNILLML